MDMTSPAIVIPKALRHDDPDFWRTLYRCGVAVSADAIRHTITHQYYQTRTTTTPPLYSVTPFHLQPRLRLPCESFTLLPDRQHTSSGPTDALVQPPVSEFQHSDRLTTSNLIDWTPKESWSCEALRADVFRAVPLRAGTGGNFLSVGAGAGDYGPWRHFRHSSVSEWLRPETSVGGGQSRWTHELSSESSDSCSTAGSLYGSDAGCASPIGFRLKGEGGREEITRLASTRLTTKISPAPVTGERSFRCDHQDCIKSFSRKEELTRHRRTHASERAFQCRICKRKFIRKDHMTKHMATHEDVSTRKRYECHETGCDRRYTRSDALSRHRSSAHGYTVPHGHAQRHTA